jgi:hypothetical protein
MRNFFRKPSPVAFSENLTTVVFFVCSLIKLAIDSYYSSFCLLTFARRAANENWYPAGEFVENAALVMAMDNLFFMLLASLLVELHLIAFKILNGCRWPSIFLFFLIAIY